ncbi:MAG: serine hydrolase, partial [Holosporaceae bacterium]|nr:serine hydrolase [Holosporaceae bacterium]
MRKVVAFLVSMLCVGVEAAKSGGAKISNDSAIIEQAILMDYETERCLFEKNSKEKCVPSSMTKLMTLYVLFSAIASGRVKLEDELPVSKVAQKMKGSRSFFQAGTEAKVEDLIRSIVVHSGNDACAVIAEGIFGDVETFVEKMNEQA